MISPCTLDDAEALVALANAAHLDRLQTPAGMRHQMTSAPPEARAIRWKAEVAGEVVGAAVAALDWFAGDPGRAFCALTVHPEHRGRGLGSSLWDVVSAHLDEIGARHTIAESREDEVSKRFAEQRGFRLASTSTSSALDPRTLPAPPAPPRGVEVRPLSAFADDLESLFRVEYEAAQDEPGESDFSGLTFESWHRDFWSYPDQDHELGVAVVAGGEVVAVTLLLTDRASGRAMSAGTSVLRAHRGRGLATLAKRHALCTAAAAGITHAFTQNDETNAPMLAINRKLGYRPFATRHGWVLERS